MHMERKWWLVDAKGKVLGRLASKIATILMGKYKPTYTPHIDNGDFVIVVNAKDIKVSGKKMNNKVYYWHTGYPGGLKQRTLKEMLEKDPTKVLYLAVKRMLPKNKLQARRLKRLKIYASQDHPHHAQKPEILSLEV